MSERSGLTETLYTCGSSRARQCVILLHPHADLDKVEVIDRAELEWLRGEEKVSQYRKNLADDLNAELTALRAIKDELKQRAVHDEECALRISGWRNCNCGLLELLERAK